MLPFPVHLDIRRMTAILNRRIFDRTPANGKQHFQITDNEVPRRRHPQYPYTQRNNLR